MEPELQFRSTFGLNSREDWKTDSGVADAPSGGSDDALQQFMEGFEPGDTTSWSDHLKSSQSTASAETGAAPFVIGEWSAASRPDAESNAGGDDAGGINEDVYFNDRPGRIGHEEWTIETGPPVEAPSAGAGVSWPMTPAGAADSFDFTPMAPGPVATWETDVYPDLPGETSGGASDDDLPEDLDSLSFDQLENALVNNLGDDDSIL